MQFSAIFRRIYRARAETAGAQTLLLLLCLAVALMSAKLPARKSEPSAPLELSIVQLHEPAVPPPSPPQTTAVKAVTPEPASLAALTPAQARQPSNSPEPQTPAESHAVAASNVTPTTASSPPVAEPPKAIAPPPLPVAAEPPKSFAIEAGYVGKVRAYLDSVKRYPTGREASLQRPQGKVRIWFVLNRTGALLESGIEDSSSHILLDQAGLNTVRRGTFPPFPDEAWNGQLSRRFTVDLAFAPAS